MTSFVRKVVAPESLLDVRVSLSDPLYRHYADRPSGSRYFSVMQMLQVLHDVLGPRVLNVFLIESADALFEVAAQLLDDHVSNPDDARPKDLQANLVANLVVQCVRKHGLKKELRFKCGEDLIRKCDFPADFKYALKVALFDQDAINRSWLVVTHHADTPVNPTGTWMQDRKTA